VLFSVYGEIGNRVIRLLGLSSRMGDTKTGREKQAHDAENRQREREVAEELARTDERPPPDDPDEPRVCHYRGCTELATFRVLERYQEETGHGAVTAEALVCQAHADDESPTNLDNAYDEYVFRVEPLPDAFEADAD
jgi:hypothetical protein